MKRIGEGGAGVRRIMRGPTFRLAVPIILSLSWAGVGAAPARADTKRAIAAFDRKDYPTAFREFRESAQQGDAEAQAGVGAMLFNRLNPPGTGTYADSERWLNASAQQGNTKGMSWLGKFYYGDAERLSGSDRVQSARQLARARAWFERAAAAGDQFAMGNLAILLDGGLGGPRDPARAAELRRQAAHGPTKVPKKFYESGPVTTMTALWQQRRYAEAVQAATGPARSGNAGAQALLARAYFEGRGVTRNDRTAFAWAQRAAAANDRDGLYYLGLMYETGRGVNRSLTKAANLYDRAIALGQLDARSRRDGLDRITGRATGQIGGRPEPCAYGIPDVTLGGCVSPETGKRIDPVTGVSDR